MMMTMEDVLEQSLAIATKDERVVDALEAIANQLELLVKILAAIRPESFDEHGIDLDAENENSDEESGWEDEGGALALDGLARMGIQHDMIDQFTVGEFRYSTLHDALAEARRLRLRRVH